MNKAMLAALVGTTAMSFGVEFGDDYQFGADASDAQKARAWDKTQQRESLLEPNKGSTAKIQRYAFGMEQQVTLATAVALDMNGNPDTHIRPQRVTCNAPVPAFARISAIKVANVGVIVGGRVDAFDFAANGKDQQLDVPTLSPSNKVRVQGDYSGLLPTGYVTSTPFVFIVSFKGPAKMVA